MKAQNQLPSIVVIDNINRIAVADDPTPESDDYGVIPASLIEQLKKIAIDFNIPLLVSPQYYQFPGEEEHQRHLSKLGNPMLPGFSEMHIRIPLNRCGPITTVYFTANMECQLVYEDGV